MAFQSHTPNQDAGHVGEPTSDQSLRLNSSSASSTSINARIPRLSKAFNSFSFSQNKPSNTPEGNSWGPYGLNLLYSPPESLVNIIFVHGLRGGSVKTWCKGGDPQLFWPKTWLPRESELQNARIYSFGYNADWKDSKAMSLGVQDFGQSLFSDLSNSPSLRHEKTPIILVGHSMGGLVIKKAVLLAHQDSQSEDLLRRIQAIFFLATPHRGSDSAKLLNHILRASTVLSPRGYISDLSRSSPSSQAVSDEFSIIADKFQLWSFYETLKTKVTSTTIILVVDRESAVLGYTHEHVQLLNADHKGVCKFDRPSDPNYIAVRNSLVRAVENILGDVLARNANESRAMLTRLESYLGIEHFAEDDLSNLREIQAEGTCTWMVDQPTFQRWSQSSERLPLVYWLTGQPGSGKSVTTSHVVAHLQKLGSDVSYYFFRHGHEEQESARGFIRQLAFQMASRSPAVRQRLSSLQEGEATLNGIDERTLWRQLFVNEILKVPLPNKQFWIIDGLDECPESTKLLALLSRIESVYPISIYLGSRKTPDLERQMLAFRNRLYSHAIERDDTRNDIRSYIEAQCDFLAVDPDYRDKLAGRILIKSDGSFLWAKLAFDELQYAYSEDAMIQALEEIPEGMSALYERVLSTMSKNTRELGLTKAVLMWAVCCIRPLNGSELQAALQLDINSKVPNIERTVEGLCGQLVRVEKNSMVQVTHATVREFLTGGCTDSLFAIKRSDAHGRAAEVCLNYLCSDELRPPRSRALVQGSKVGQSVFSDYAITSWSDHLIEATAQSDSLLKLVSRFLDTNVLSWMKLLASRKKDLSSVGRAAKNLHNYLDQRAEDLSPLGVDPFKIRQWATDLLRVVVKFGRNLLLEPSAIYFIVPPLCPAESSIYRQFGVLRDSLSLGGHKTSSWGDCISYIRHPDDRIMSLAGGDNMLAIGLKSGSVKVYEALTSEEKLSLHHGEPVRLIKFDHTCQHIVTSGNKNLKMWNADGETIWETAHATAAVSVEFSQDDALLVACTRTSNVLSWNTIDGTEPEFDPFQGLDLRQPRRNFDQTVLSSSISPDLHAIALAYRGRPPQIWSLEKNVLIGSCEKQALSVSQVLFNPDPSVEVLAATYEDGQLATFNTWNQRELVTVSGDAYLMTISPDGKIVASGDYQGTIKLWDFETLRLLYRIKSPDYDIRRLAFSGDGLRLFDISVEICKVWEPPALIRGATNTDLSTGETFGANEDVTSLGSFGQMNPINHMVLSPDHDCIFVGKDDGGIHAFDIATGAFSHLYSHRHSISSISWSDEAKHLATLDISMQLQIWRLEQHSSTSWKATINILNSKLGGPSDGCTHGIKLSPDASHLLAFRRHAQTMVLKVPELSSETLPKIESYATWRALSSGDTSVLVLGASGKLLVAHYGEAALPYASVKLLDDNQEVLEAPIAKMSVDASRTYFLVELQTDRRKQQAPRALVYGLQRLLYASEIDDACLLPLWCRRASEVMSVLGFYDSRIVYLDKSLWIRSEPLNGARDKESLQDASTASRYLFIPSEIVGGSNGVDGVATTRGDLVFPIEGELAIFRNALAWTI